MQGIMDAPYRKTGTNIIDYYVIDVDHQHPPAPDSAYPGENAYQLLCIEYSPVRGIITTQLCARNPRQHFQ